MTEISMSLTTDQFIVDLKRLLRDSPQLAVDTMGCENSPYGDHIFTSKNCYLCFEVGGSSDGYYLDNCMKTINCVDCSFVRYSELCYQCLNLDHCYNCNYCVTCVNCTDCSYCFDCIGCNDCYGCVGLRRQRYCIYNEQLTKEEYEKRMKGIQFDGARYRALELAHPRPFANHVRSEDCVGDYVIGSKGCYGCFDVTNMEDCYYYCNGNYNRADKDCCDMDNGSGNELCYECYATGRCYNSNFLVQCHEATNCEFGWNLATCSDCLGCVYLKSKSYMILNKQYPKEEYLSLKNKIVQELKTQGKYGFELMLPNPLSSRT